MQSGLRKGTWSVEEDNCLRKCIEKYGEGKWHLIPERAGLNRCRKSCRLRWLNYLSPNIKRGKFKEDEDELIIKIQGLLGNRWSLIASKLPGRTANGIKNYWNSHLRKKLLARENGSTEFINGKATKDTLHKGQVTRLESKWPEPNGTAKDIQIMDLNINASSSVSAATVSGHDEQFFNDLFLDNQFGEREMLAFSGSGEGNSSGCIV